MKRKVVLIVLLLLVFSGLGYGGYFAYQITHPNTVFDNNQEMENIVEEESDPKEEVEETAEVVQPEAPQEEIYKFLQDRVNILVLGIDSSVDRLGKMRNFRSDTIIVLSIDFKGKKVYMLSIPRDSYVDIYNRKERNKINSAFSLGGGAEKDGFLYSMNTVSKFLGGIPIDYYVGFNMNVVKEVIDAMGGVEYNVDVPVRIAGRELKPGLQRLNGQQVLDYSRWRYTRKGDIDRVDRQQRILFAIFEQMKSTEQILNIPTIYQKVQENMYTNLNFKQIVALAYFAKDLQMSDLKRYSAPGEFLNIDGISYWGILQKEKQEMIKEIFGVTIKIDPKDDVKYIKKEIEETRKEIAQAVSNGNKVVESAKSTLEKYKDILTSEETEKLNGAITDAEAAIDSEVLDEINKYVPILKSVNNSIASVGKERKAAIDAANETISSVQKKIAGYKEFITNEEKSAIEAKINTLKQSIQEKSTTKIKEGTDALKSVSQPIFDKYAGLQDAIKEGSKVIEKGRNALKNAYVSGDDRSTVNSCIENIENVLGSKDESSIRAVVKEADNKIDKCLSRAKSFESSVKKLLNYSKNDLTPEQREPIQGKIDALENAIAAKNYDQIKAAADDLLSEVRKINPDYKF